MKTPLDTKSILIGLAIAVVSILAIGATTGEEKEIGRYQIAGAGTPSVFVVVDTVTGKVWMGNGTSSQLRSDGDFFAPKSK